MTKTKTNEAKTNERLPEGTKVRWKGQSYELDGYTKGGKARLLDADGEKRYAPADEVQEDITARGMAATLNRYKPGYQDCVAYSGALSQNNGDPIARALEGKSPDETMAWAEKLLGLEEGALVKKYERLNPGQKRMNSGNRVRNAWKRGDLTDEQVLAA